ncbi:MAG: hypothetical protein ACJATT_005893, partial [Myxococcota bacterium]
MGLVRALRCTMVTVERRRQGSAELVHRVVRLARRDTASHGCRAGDVTNGGRDAGGRERLCRYLARPALARTRLEETPTGLIRVTVKRPWA